ncbi:hypothetical protein [Chitiniphilus shinanonensis]|uniref:hypothetical protein n=1 Tax=Chitiniphilus shinanonensis TaxID=553088 RepID=UPI003340EB89
MIYLDSGIYILAWQRAKQLTNLELINFVRSRDAATRNLIIQELHARPFEDVFQAALLLISEGQAQSRASGYLILGQLGTPDRPFRDRSTPIILQGLEKERVATVQSAILYAIGHLKPPQSTHKEILKKIHYLLSKKTRSILIASAFSLRGLSISEELELVVRKIVESGDPEAIDWALLGIESLKDCS